MTDHLADVVWAHDELAEMDEPGRRLALRQLVAEAHPSEPVAEIVRQLSDEIDGYGPLSDLMRDEVVTDVLVNGPHEVWCERRGRLERTSVSFASEEALRHFVERHISRAGGRADVSQPIADARLADGSRIHVVLPPVAPAGPLVSIRRFPRASFSLADLTFSGMLTQVQSRDLRNSVAARRTIAISGGTGTGKTTLLNALLSEIGLGERVVVIEETRELRLTRHAVSLVARAPNVEGAGAVGLPALLRASLRMRPDRIVVGEVRGAEALVALEAMSTGHDGSMVTLHARSAHDAIERMVTLALQASSRAEEQSLRSQARRAIDVVVHLERRARTRRAVEIFEPA